MIGVTRDIDSKKETIILWVSSNQTPYVETKPLHESQIVYKEHEDGSNEFERKLLGYGSHIKVIKPLSLKQRIANELILAAERYKG